MKTNTLKLIILLVFSAPIISNAQNEWDRYGCDYNKHYFHHVALFNGITSSLENPEPFYTLGAAYRYSPRSWDHWSISAMAEVIFKEQLEWVLVIPFVYQANDNVWLRFGIGTELIRDLEQKLAFYNLPLIRLGGGYNFHWKFLTIAPSIDLDIVRNHPAAVIGLNIGYAF